MSKVWRNKKYKQNLFNSKKENTKETAKMIKGVANMSNDFVHLSFETFFDVLNATALHGYRTCCF